MKRQLIQLIISTLLITACSSDKGQSMNPRKDIIVIGAGAAGLAAAKTLQKNGHRVIVLEARERIGGRLWSDRTSITGAVLDMGASWIHGIENNPIHNIVTDQSLTTQATDYNNIIVYDANGSPNLFTNSVRKNFEDNLNDQIDTLIDTTPNASIQNAIDAVVSDMGQGTLSDGEVNYIANSSIEHEYAADVSELSVISLDEGEGFEGGDVTLNEGYDRIAEYLANDLDIRMGHAVTNIDYSDELIKITTVSEGILLADKVVITVPLGVLKKSSIVFKPALPQNKLNAIQGLGMGVLNKLYLKFPSVFWDTDVDLIGHVSDTQKGQWSEWLNLYKYTGTPILLGFNAGTYGKEIEALSDQQIVDAAMETLRNIYGAGIPDPLPSGIAISRWNTDEYAYGSYSFLKAGANIGMRATLAEPVQNKLFFAGEATHSDYPATVHGAYLSGLREAKRIN